MVAPRRRNVVGMSPLETRANSRAMSIHPPRRHRCSRILPEAAVASLLGVNLRCSEHAAAEPIELGDSYEVYYNRDEILINTGPKPGAMREAGKTVSTVFGTEKSR
jgi:hypothetical protein